jgi:branched-chain amino acid transport system substrate-binding protein
MRHTFLALLFSLFLTTTAHAEILLATVGPMTGQNASIGEQMRRGAELAVKHINANGGLLGQHVNLSVMDDVCDPKQATTVAQKLVNDGAVFVAGHFCSGASSPASNIYSEEGIVMISPASTVPALTDRKLDGIFRLCGRDDQQGVIGAQYLLKTFANKNIAIIHDKTAYGKGLADVAKASLHKNGVQEVLYEAITVGERDFSALVTKMKQAKVDVIFYGGYYTEAGLIVRQAHDQGLKAPLMAGDSLITKEFWTITGAAGNGTLMTFSPDPRLEPTAQPIVEEFRKTGYEPEGYALFNYAAVMIYADAVKKANSTKLPDVLKALHSNPFATIIGTIQFDAKGDVTAPAYRVYNWKDGAYIYAK